MGLPFINQRRKWPLAKSARGDQVERLLSELKIA